MYPCEQCGKRWPSIWAAAYCCDPWPAEADRSALHPPTVARAHEELT